MSEHLQDPVVEPVPTEAHPGVHAEEGRWDKEMEQKDWPKPDA